MYLIVWRDYDHNEIEEYEEKEDAEAKITELMAIIDGKDNYRTRIDAVIQGNKLKYKTIEVASKCVIED